MTLDEYIAARVVEDGDCLRWTGYTYNGHPGGYIDGKKFLIRRALWLRDRGPVPERKVLRCTCETPGCINLDHLRPMTFQQIAKIEGAAGKMSGPVRSARIAAVKRAGKQARITQDDARAIRTSDEKLAALAERYGISQSSVSRIKRSTVRREFTSSVWQGLGA